MRRKKTFLITKETKKQQSSLWIWQTLKSDHTAFFSTRPRLVAQKINRISDFFSQPFQCNLNEKKSVSSHLSLLFLKHSYSTLFFVLFQKVILSFFSYQKNKHPLLSLKSFFPSLMLPLSRCCILMTTRTSSFRIVFALFVNKILYQLFFTLITKL